MPWQVALKMAPMFEKLMELMPEICPVDAGSWRSPKNTGEKVKESVPLAFCANFNNFCRSKDVGMSKPVSEREKNT